MNLGDHTETIQVDFDPNQITYEELLDIFWNSHDATQAAYSRQYMSVIFYHNEEQRQVIEKSKSRQEEKLGKPILTEIVPYSRFYWAEDYHQKYYLRGERDFMTELLSVYPNNEDFVNSTSAARLNGYVGRNGTLDALEKELDSLGLSPEASQKLWDHVASYDRSRRSGAGSTAGGSGECPLGTCG